MPRQTRPQLQQELLCEIFCGTVQIEGQEVHITHSTQGVGVGGGGVGGGGSHQEPFSIGQCLFHPGSKEYCCEGQQRPRNQHEDPVSLQHLLLKGVNANIP